MYVLVVDTGGGAELHPRKFEDQDRAVAYANTGAILAAVAIVEISADRLADLRDRIAGAIAPGHLFARIGFPVRGYVPAKGAQA